MKRIIAIGILLLTLVGCSHSKQKNTTTLNVYELQDGNEIYRITSANYDVYENYSSKELVFYSNHKSKIGNIWFTVLDKPTRVTRIRSFESRQDTTSYIRIR